MFAEAEAHPGVSLIVAYAPCQMHVSPLLSLTGAPPLPRVTQPACKKHASLLRSLKGRPCLTLAGVAAVQLACLTEVIVRCVQSQWHSQLVVVSFCQAHAVVVCLVYPGLQGIASGMKCSAAAAKRAVATGYWPLWHYHPPLAATPGDCSSVLQQQQQQAAGVGQLVLDSRQVAGGGSQLEEFLGQQNRFNILSRSQPGASVVLHQQLQQQINAREARLQELSRAGAHKLQQQGGVAADVAPAADSTAGSSSA